MENWYYKSAAGNVGDELNAWIWPKFFGADFFDHRPDTRFIGVGSVLDDRHKSAKKKIVFGSGARGRRSIPDLADGSWDIRFVRGPLTAAALASENTKFISDPALLVPIAMANGGASLRQPKRTGKIGLIAHYLTDPQLVLDLARDLGVTPISVNLEIEQFAAELQSCDATICEAMHGAILSEAFRIPWIGVRIQSPRFEGKSNRFKWRDFMQSLDISPSRMRPFPATGILPGRVQRALPDRPYHSHLGQLKRVIDDQCWDLCPDNVLQRAQDAMQEEVDHLRRKVVHS